MLLTFGIGAQAARAAPQGGVFIVNSNADAVDGAIGDGDCSTNAILGPCTLRAAIQEANANPDLNTIVVPAGTYTLMLTGAPDDLGVSGDLDITEAVTILGAGPTLTIIDGNGGLTADRVFEVHGGTVNLTGVSVRNGRAGGPGSGIANRSGAALTLTNSDVQGSVAAIAGGIFGGGIYSEGRLTLTSSTVMSNTNGPSNAAGGGVVHVGLGPDAGLLISNTTISGNSTVDLGGGLYAGATVVTITNSTLSNNQAQAGGGLFAYDTQLALVNSTLSANSSTDSGGGLFNHTGQTRLFNVTVTNNTADSDANGTGSGGGAAAPSGSLRLQNSIIAGNVQLDPFGGGGVLAVEDDCSGSLTSDGYNLIYAATCTIGGPYSPAWPVLGPLANNGGPTRTHALLPGSPAIDAGHPAGCVNWDGAPLRRDQRGVSRPRFGEVSVRCDIGAFEVVGPLWLPLVRR